MTLDGEQVRYRGTDGKEYVAIKPEDAEITDLLIDKGIPIKAESQEQSGFQTFILSLLPFLSADRCLGLLHEPYAGWPRRWSDGVR